MKSIQFQKSMSRSVGRWGGIHDDHTLAVVELQPALSVLKTGREKILPIL